MVQAGAEWAELSLEVGLGGTTILMQQLVERTALQVAVRSTPGIQRCLVQEGVEGGPPRLQVEGLNVGGLAGLMEVDMEKLRTNDVHAVLVTLGVEAARSVIVTEVRRVFGMYGINVDPRHLSLIADFMTQEGGYRACNRIGIESSASPLQKMSFETAMHFLVDATLHGQRDALKSPSARIVMGQVVEMGTGAFGLMQDLEDRTIGSS